MGSCICHDETLVLVDHVCAHAASGHHQHDFAVQRFSHTAVHRHASAGSSPVLPEHTGVYELHLEAKATLGNASLQDCIRLPWGVGRSEWIAAKTVALFQEVVGLVTVLEGTCTPETCPCMACGKHVVYQWADDKTSEARDLAAIDYMRTLVEYAHEMLGDKTVLPQDGGPFPEHFLRCMQTLHKRFFRVYAHTYLHHFDTIQEHDAEKHLNFCFKHWLFFVREFELVGDEDLRPLRQLVHRFEAAARQQEDLQEDLKESLQELEVRLPRLMAAAAQSRRRRGSSSDQRSKPKPETSVDVARQIAA